MQPDAELRIRKLRIAVDTDDAELGLRVLRQAEALVPSILEELAATLGEEVLILRKVELGLLLRSLGDLEPGPALARALRSALRTLLADARAGTGAGAVSYPSEASALAAYLGALSRGRAASWPFVALRHWGSSPAEALERGAARGVLFVADTLAELARASVLLRAVPTELAPRLLRRLADGDRDALAPAELPEAVLHELGQLRLRLPETAAPDHAQLALIGQLFATWPPARGLRVSGAELETTLRRRAMPLAPATPESGAPGPRDQEREPIETHPADAALVSAAGALVFWAHVFSRLAIDIGALYPAARVARAVRHAVGRALETASLSRSDPLLLLWAGEGARARAHFDGVLAEVDAEPLHVLALSLAARLGYLDGSLRIVPIGDEQVALAAGGLVVDSTVAEDGDAALPALVRDLARRIPGLELSVELAGLDGGTLDAVAEVDAPFARPALQRALRALTSVLRRFLREQLRAELPATRGWVAVQRGDAIEIRRRDAARVSAGRWTEHGVELSNTRYRIVLI